MGTAFTHAVRGRKFISLAPHFPVSGSKWWDSMHYRKYTIYDNAFALNCFLSLFPLLSFLLFLLFLLSSGKIPLVLDLPFKTEWIVTTSHTSTPQLALNDACTVNSKYISMMIKKLTFSRVNTT